MVVSGHLLGIFFGGGRAELLTVRLYCLTVLLDCTNNCTNCTVRTLEPYYATNSTDPQNPKKYPMPSSGTNLESGTMFFLGDLRQI